MDHHHIATKMASVENGQGAEKMLAVADIQEIISTTAENGKAILAKKLGLDPYMDPKDLQKAPFISYLYDNIAFATEKGFPWMHVCLVVKFAHEFLKRILVKDHCLADTILEFKEKASIIAPLNDRHKKQYTDFVHQSVLCHYNLYKYVFSHLREKVCPKVHKEVEVPPSVMPLSQGKDIVVWEYTNKEEAVEAKEKEAAKFNLERLEKLRGSNETDHKKLEDLQEEPLPYSKMTLSELVKDILKGYAERKEAELHMIADATAEDLQYKFERTNIARPAVLGPPKRFKPKSPVGRQASNINNNAQGKGNKDKAPKSPRAKSGRGSNNSAASKK